MESLFAGAYYVVSLDCGMLLAETNMFGGSMNLHNVFSFRMDEMMQRAKRTERAG